MKLQWVFCIVTISIISNCQAQSNHIAADAIEKFVSYIEDGVSIDEIFFCTSYLPDSIQHNLPSRVNNHKCNYFLTENTIKICKKKKMDCFYTIEIIGESPDTADFIFTLVNVTDENGSYETYAECRGMNPITPDIRIINMPNGKREVQSRIRRVGCTVIRRDLELH